MSTGRKGIDWAALKARLQQGPGAERQKVEEVFRRRAERLAVRKELPGAAAEGWSVLAFYLGEECCAIELAELAEVLPFAGCAPLPGASPELLGVLNRRGELWPVVDLAALLGLPRDTEESPGQVLLLRRQALGLRVGRVDQVRVLAPEELVRPGEGASLPGRCAKGLVPGALLLLDIEMILSHPLFKEASG